MTRKRTGETPRYWLCRVCGYICEGQEPLEICPICGATREYFSPYDLLARRRPPSEASGHPKEVG